MNIDGKTLRQMEKQIRFPALAKKANEAYLMAETGNLNEALHIFRDIMTKIGIGAESAIWLHLIESLYTANPPQKILDAKTTACSTQTLHKLLAAGAGWSGSSAIFDYYRNFENVQAIHGEFMHINGKYGLHGLIFGEANNFMPMQETTSPLLTLQELRNAFRYCFFGITACEDRTQIKHSKNARLFLINGGEKYACAVGHFIENVISHNFERKAIGDFAEAFIDACCYSRMPNSTDIVALDNILPAYRLEMLNFFSNIRVAAVMRDPRDQFIDNKLHNKNFTRTAEAFSRRYRQVHEYVATYTERFPERIRIVNFNEFVSSNEYRYSFAQWAGLADKKEAWQYFVASDSQKNTCLFNKNPIFADEVARIQKKLAEYSVATAHTVSQAKSVYPNEESLPYADTKALLTSLQGNKPNGNLLSGHIHKSTKELRNEFQNNRFLIYPTLGEFITLIPPINWHQDPFSNRSWSSLLHSLKFLGVGIQSQDTNLLRTCANIALDWIAQNSPRINKLPVFAWSDKIVGDRIQVLAYLFRILASESLLSVPQAETFLNSIREHADYLTSDKFYRVGHNHGLAQDVGLYVCSVYLSFLPEAQAWRNTAFTRFLTGIKSQYSPEGIHLEHSPGYHFLVSKWIFKMLDLAKHANEPRLPELEEFKNKVASISPWLVTPQGFFLHVGDSKKSRPPAWLSPENAAYGLQAFLAGYGIYKDESTYLFLTAGHHSPAHKQSDDLSFVLVESGQTILTEAGRYSYEKRDSERRYVESVWGHNVLLVDGKDFNTKLRASAYGSGILGVASAAGWQAMCAYNPVLYHDFQVAHKRLLLLKPREQFIVIDVMQATQPHTYTSILHFSPELKVNLEQGKLASLIAGQETWGEWFSSVPMQTELYCGYNGEQLKGWVATDYLKLAPAPTTETTIHGKNAFLGFSLNYSGQPRNIEEFQDLGSHWLLQLKDPTLITIKIQKKPFSITVCP
ncbi:heparinase II/III family protein [Legionella septentrionalis]|uniref:Alginate lyase family protein n=1 Tax=Legionella septentrionalis TaxID=2498109 RepID=A0A3S0XUK0_9GAMM|nr:heparinase II/III family protein [Legionella septentrionalis]RUQ91059.1 alginate lyase family protein [Legionella septentrionalis]RUR11470.1 alginate lyase family protein [Legionella septentrionalis]